MWGLNDTSKIPENWEICDGRGMTPDLTDKFIIGGDTVGSDSKVQYKHLSKYTSEKEGCDKKQYLYYIRLKVTLFTTGTDDNIVTYIPGETIEAPTYKSDNKQNAITKAKSNCPDNPLDIEDRIDDMDHTDNSLEDMNIACSAVHDSTVNNPNHYIDNPNCISEGYREVPRYKLIFIMRIK
jgi:hypothetical protein